MVTEKQHLQNLLIEIEAGAEVARTQPTQAARIKAYRQALHNAAFWIKETLTDIEAQETEQRPEAETQDPEAARNRMKILTEV